MKKEIVEIKGKLRNIFRPFEKRLKRIKDVSFRILFCLFFAVIIFYAQSYHGELINNAEARWQYVKDREGNLYLALDVHSPSGIKIEEIFSSSNKVTDSWTLINYPWWYKGSDDFPALSQFQEELHPYLPFNKDYQALYTTERYTFIYKWNATTSSIPPEATIRVKYKNLGTLNSYYAKHVSGVRVITSLIELKDGNPGIDLQIYLPKETLLTNTKVLGNNLMPISGFYQYGINDLTKYYAIKVLDEKGDVKDILLGIIRYDSQKAYHIYFKSHESINLPKKQSIDLTEIVRHFTAIMFIFYFAFISWGVGRKFIQWRGMGLEGTGEKLVIPIFLGLIILTYLFFVIGTFKLLYFPLVFVILVITLFFVITLDDLIYALRTLKTFLISQLVPWRIIFLILLGLIILYHLSYCFIPATYIDGDGDIVNSYLLLLNDYIGSHSFSAAIQNAIYGLCSPAVDVLKTVVKMFIGEPGVYLLSFLYFLLIIGTLILIGRRLFNIKNTLIYITVFLLLSANLFTERIHLGKVHIAALSFLLISLYSIRFSDHQKNYLLPALFFAFLTSQYAHFAGIVFVYYFFIFIYSFYQHKTMKSPAFGQHVKSFVVYCAFSSIFYVKFLIEVGVCLPPAITPDWLDNIFAKINQNNANYKYIDNNYLRYFFKLWGIALSDEKRTMSMMVEKILGIKDIVNFWFILFLLPFLRKINKTKMLFILLNLSLILLFIVIFPNNVGLRIYYLYPLIILQFAVIDSCLFRLMNVMPAKNIKLRRGIKFAFILVSLCIVMFDFSNSKIKVRQAAFLNDWYPMYKEGHFWEALDIFSGRLTKYQYLKTIQRDGMMFKEKIHKANKNFDHAMLIRQYTKANDTLLIVPVRFHSHTHRRMTARHALGSVIYQKDVKKIMSELKKLNIGYLSTMPITYRDYNPFFSPLFLDENFSKYCQLLFSDKGCAFYKIIYDGSNKEYTPSPFKVEGLTYVPMLKEDMD